MGKAKTGLRVVGLVAAAALTAAACGGGSDGDTDTPGTGGGKAEKGGTLTFLTLAKQIGNLDPQRNYTGEDLAFAGAYLHRSLTAYKRTPDEVQSNEIIGDLATDTGKPTNNAKTWAFTLKDGIKFEDGSPITCADVKYGVSRVFATKVITDGPQYPVSMFDIPKEKDKEGNEVSVYKGPYDTSASNNKAAYDKAVTCSPDNKTITFQLAKPVGDFNYTVTLLTFSPVPKAKDTGEKYQDKPVSNGPYKIQEYTKGTQLVLVRNENWDPATETDNYRPAYPDSIVMKFGLDASVIDQRIIADAGPDQQAVNRGSVEPSSLATVFNDDRFKDRRMTALDPYSRYYALNTKKLPNLKHRHALMVALNRAQLRTISGGTFAGDLSDGPIKPNLAKDYAPTGVWEDLLGQKIPDTGDPAYAKKLIAESGAPMKSPLQFDYPQTPTNDKLAAAFVSSMKLAGITIKPNPIEAGQYYGIVFDPAKAGDIINAGWGPDWANASTVIPELFTPSGGFNLSQADDKAFNAKVDAAKALTDRDAQAEQWKELNKETVKNGWIIPRLFGRANTLAGSKVGTDRGEGGHVYYWSPYGSWPYHDMYVKK